MSTVNKNEAKVECKAVYAYIEDGGVYLCLVYDITDKDGSRTITVPKAKLPIRTTEHMINTMHVAHLHDSTRVLYEPEISYIGLYSDHMLLEEDSQGHTYYVKDNAVKKPTKMTMEELEKALGYKVEIVSKK